LVALVVNVRISKTEYYLNIAKTVATRSTCLKHKYGAVIVNNDVIVSTGYNGSPRGELNCCDTGICHQGNSQIPVNANAAAHGNQYGSCVAVHAEQNAIIAVSHKELNGAALYLACLSNKPNIGPCNICDRIIKNANIAQVITKEDVS